MPFSLYDATIANYVQILDALSGLIDRAEAFCNEKQWQPGEIIQARLAPDMHPFAYQIKSAAVHSLGAVEGVRRGSFSPDTSEPPPTFAALRSRVRETLTALQAIDAAEINSFVGRDMRFVAGTRSIDFAAEDFLLSFSQPNFFFHATTAYDIMRWKGVPIGKRDFLGRYRKRR
jgi:uncharacterized protein